MDHNTAVKTLLGTSKTITETDQLKFSRRLARYARVHTLCRADCVDDPILSGLEGVKVSVILSRLLPPSIHLTLSGELAVAADTLYQNPLPFEIFRNRHRFSGSPR